MAYSYLGDIAEHIYVYTPASTFSDISHRRNADWARDRTWDPPVFHSSIGTWRVSPWGCRWSDSLGQLQHNCMFFSGSSSCCCFSMKIESWKKDYLKIILTTFIKKITTLEKMEISNEIYLRLRIKKDKFCCLKINL